MILKLKRKERKESCLCEYLTAHIKTVKTCQGSEILPDFPCDKLACHSSIDAVTRPKTPGSKMKDYITHSTASSMRINI